MRSFRVTRSPGGTATGTAAAAWHARPVIARTAALASSPAGTAAQPAADGANLVSATSAFCPKAWIPAAERNALRK
jgi:hypothetical protein